MGLQLRFGKCSDHRGCPAGGLLPRLAVWAHVCHCSGSTLQLGSRKKQLHCSVTQRVSQLPTLGMCPRCACWSCHLPKTWQPLCRCAACWPQPTLRQLCCTARPRWVTSRCRLCSRPSCWHSASGRWHCPWDGVPSPWVSVGMSGHAAGLQLHLLKHAHAPGAHASGRQWLSAHACSQPSLSSTWRRLAHHTTPLRGLPPAHSSGGPQVEAWKGPAWYVGSVFLLWVRPSSCCFVPAGSGRARPASMHPWTPWTLVPCRHAAACPH